MFMIMNPVVDLEGDAAHSSPFEASLNCCIKSEKARKPAISLFSAAYYAFNSVTSMMYHQEARLIPPVPV